MEVAHFMSPPHHSDLLFFVLIEEHGWSHFPSCLCINNVSSLQGFILSFRGF